jgi:hypothetical protein
VIICCRVWQLPFAPIRSFCWQQPHPLQQLPTCLPPQRADPHHADTVQQGVMVLCMSVCKLWRMHVVCLPQFLQSPLLQATACITTGSASSLQPAGLETCTSYLLAIRACWAQIMQVLLGARAAGRPRRLCLGMFSSILPMKAGCCACSDKQQLGGIGDPLPTPSSCD